MTTDPPPARVHPHGGQEDGRLGICCQLLLDEPEEQARHSFRTTTIAWLTRQTPAAAFDRLASIARHNLDALEAQIRFVAALPPEERMFRIQSGMFPGWSHPAASAFWADADLDRLIERRLDEIGALARARDVRLSMHPGQHAVVATMRPDAYANAVVDIMDHVRQMALMGYGGGWHPHGAHINVHGGAGGAGVDGLRRGLAAMPAEALALLTLENDEYSFGLDDLLRVGDACAVVADFHHHWLHSRGEYLTAADPRVGRIVDSWRGTRPAAHISVSPEALYDVPIADELPDFDELINAGFGKAELRAHSTMMWNLSVNDLVADHLAWCDIEVEAKAKNRAARQLADHVRARRLASA